MTNRRWLLGAGALSLLLIWGSLLLFTWDHSFSVYDDAYIYLQYLKNILGGCGPTYNCGDPAVEGFTSPLYLMLLLAFQPLFQDPVATTQFLGLMFLGGALSMAALAPLHPRLRGKGLAVPILAGLTTALVLGLDHFILLNSVTGMETSLSCFMVMALGLALLLERPNLLAVLLILGVLTRPEFMVFIPASILLPWTRTRRFWLSLVMAGGIIAATRWYLFQDLLPNTFYAKSGGTLRHAELGLDYILETIQSFPLILLAPLGLIRRRPDRRGLLLAGVTLIWFGFFLRSGGDSFRYSRLAMPLIPLLTLLGARGLIMAAADLSARLPRIPSPVWTGAAAGLLVLVSVRAGVEHRLEESHGFDNVLRYEMVGIYLGDHHPGWTAAVTPVGAIAYFSNLRIIDQVGLTCREIAKAGRSVPPELLSRNWIGHERNNAEWVLAQEPELIITTKYSDKPWTDLARTQAGIYADWLLLRAIKEGRAPYRIYSPKIVEGLYWLMFIREDLVSFVEKN